MTREQLDGIEKLAEEDMNDPWSEGEGAYRQALRDHALPLVKALREAWEERDKYKSALDAELPAAWREDIESLNSCLERIGKERDEARAEVERLKAALEEVREKNGSLADRIEKADSELRDAWKAEDRLKATLRLLWEEAQDDSRCQVESGYGHLISQPCWEAVEAALKEEG